MIYVKLMILTSIALLFSTFSSPALSALLTFFVFIIGHFSADLKSLATSTASISARWLFAGLYYLLPNLSNYSYITPAAHGQTPCAMGILAAFLYEAIYIAFVLPVATLVFSLL